MTGKRGLVVGISEPRRTIWGAVEVDLFYFQNALSAAHWTCAVQMDIRGWRVSPCALTGMA